MAERKIAKYCTAHSLRAISLRYFHAAGADSKGEVGRPMIQRSPGLQHPRGPA